LFAADAALFKSQALFSQFPGLPGVGIPVDEVLQVGIKEAIHSGLVLGDGLFEGAAFLFRSPLLLSVDLGRFCLESLYELFSELDAPEDAR
jgi:hypothetical protein